MLSTRLLQSSSVIYLDLAVFAEISPPKIRVAEKMVTFETFSEFTEPNKATTICRVRELSLI